MVVGAVFRDKCFLHAHKALPESVVNFQNRRPDLVGGSNNFCRIELIVGALCCENFVLLLNGEIAPGKVGVNVLLVHRQHLVVRNCPRVAEVVNTHEVVFGHFNRRRQHVAQDRHAVRHIHDFVVARDFGHEVTRGEVVGDGHAEAQHHGRLVRLEHVLQVTLYTKGNKSSVS